ncbi:murein transglycosylase [Vibrio makurazakiensis]|uniref:murein transglycosylase n=1 Tax=Vibrio makurazakiensis TaxID=2910250 RepID=UPI003D0CB2FC
MFSQFFRPKFVAISSAVLSTLFATHTVSASTVSELEKQRTAYEKAQDILDGRDLLAYKAIRPQIEDYSLTPYTDYRAFLLELPNQSPQQVNQFIDNHFNFPFSHRVRAPYLSELEKQERWGAILEFQSKEPVGEEYQCIYYRAHLEQGNADIAFKGADKLWLSGSGIADQCDPLFEAWDKAGLRTDDVILDRMLLAFDNRNGTLMSYLIKQIDNAQTKQKATEMKELYRNPESVLTFAKKNKATDFYRSQTEYAFEKLARKDVSQAQSKYEAVVKAQNFSSEKAQELAEYLAFRLINTDDEDLAQWRDEVLERSSRQVLVERRIRLAIQYADWAEVTRWIALLDEEHQASLRWQYWLGRAEVESGNEKAGYKRLQAITGERNFYSVAAAKEVKQSIKYSTSTVSFDRSLVKPYLVDLHRIDELITLDKIAAAKSEWRWLLKRASREEQSMLAAYAAEKNWNHLTVTASITAKMWDNISLRFPVAHQWWFKFYAEKHDIDPITLLSLARQESALDSEARSPVGARGIMQIMPTTAKYTAKKYKIPYQGSDELYEVGKNIEIGSHYLDGLLTQYDNNRIFAFAAYNAGPNRVKRWRERTAGKLDAYAFIEAIPFKETRGYVQNILMFETYYRDLMGVDGAFLRQYEAETKY